MIVVGITSYGLNNPRLLDLTVRCIDSIFGQGISVDLQIIVVNDISIGGESKAIYHIGRDKSWNVNRLTVIDVKYNNLSRSWNDICRIVFRENKNSDRILILNNDIALWKDSLKRLIEFSEHNPQVGMIYGSDKGHENDLMFSAFLIRKDLYDRVGKFDENLPFYYNDWDYLERCKSIGQNPFYFYDFQLLHERSKTRNEEMDITETWKKIHSDSISYYRNKWKDKGVRLP